VTHVARVSDPCSEVPPEPKAQNHRRGTGILPVPEKEKRNRWPRCEPALHVVKSFSLLAQATGRMPVPRPWLRHMEAPRFVIRIVSVQRHPGIMNEAKNIPDRDKIVGSSTFQESPADLQDPTVDDWEFPFT